VKTTHVSQTVMPNDPEGARAPLNSGPDVEQRMVAVRLVAGGPLPDDPRPDVFLDDVLAEYDAEREPDTGTADFMELASTPIPETDPTSKSAST